MRTTFYILAATLMLACCATPKAVEHHHHHSEQADTMAIQAQVDKHLKSWHAQIDSSLRQRMEEYSASWLSHDDEKEKVTETITTFVDSLGREVRQEQRTTERSLSRLQQQTEQRLSREMETRLSMAIDSINSVWQKRYDALQTHFEQTDSAHVKETPVADALPWYKRWWQTLKDYLLMAAILALLVITWKWWSPLLRKMF